MPKMYSDTYIYRQYPEYEKKLYGFILNADRINTRSKEFEDILYDIKRRKINDSLIKIITSDNVVLCTTNDPLPKVFRVFPAKDLKEDKTKIKVFVDVSGCVVFKDGVYICNNMEWLISYVINAMVSYIYAVADTKFTNNASILKTGGEAFVRCMNHVIDRMYKISTVRQLSKRVDYMSAIYWQVCLLGRDLDKNYDSIIANAIKLSDIERRDSAVVDAFVKNTDFLNINSFITSMAQLGFKDIKTSNIIDYWMKIYGTGTVLGIEYFPTFSAMLTNTYIGGYLDQQLTIEKITGPSMVQFTKLIFQIGESVS